MLLMSKALYIHEYKIFRSEDSQFLLFTAKHCPVMSLSEEGMNETVTTLRSYSCPVIIQIILKRNELFEKIHVVFALV